MLEDFRANVLKQPGVGLIWICMDVSYLLLCTCTERTNMYYAISQG